MKKVKITLEVVTHMFSSGSDRTKAEFRITELKALLRSTFREFFQYTSLEDLQEKEGILFGNTKIKSPVTIKFGENGSIRNNSGENLVLHKNVPAKALLTGTRVNIIFQSRNHKFLELYVYILKLASMVGGLGKRSRKGMGSFKIENIDDSKNFGISLKDIINEPICCETEINTFEGKKKTCIFKRRKLSIEQEKNNYIKYKIECNDSMEDIHYAKYLHKILIENIVDGKNRESIIEEILRNISRLTHERLSKWEKFFSEQTINKIKDLGDINFSKGKEMKLFNKQILGNCSGEKPERFASPIYVTIYQEGQGKDLKAYLIIKELNYNYIYNQIINKKVCDKEKKLRDMNRVVAKEIKEKIRKEINSQVQEMKLIDSEYIAGYVNKIKECCGGKI